jgi:hypothetical protein
MNVRYVLSLFDFYNKLYEEEVMVESHNVKSYWRRVYVTKRKPIPRRRKRRYFGSKSRKSRKSRNSVLVKTIKINISNMVNSAPQRVSFE